MNFSVKSFKLWAFLRRKTLFKLAKYWVFELFAWVFWENCLIFFGLELFSKCPKKACVLLLFCCPSRRRFLSRRRYLFIVKFHFLKIVLFYNRRSFIDHFSSFSPSLYIGSRSFFPSWLHLVLSWFLSAYSLNLVLYFHFLCLLIF